MPFALSRSEPTLGPSTRQHGQAWRVVLRSLLVLSIYLAAAAYLFRHAWAAPASLSIGFYTDPQQFMWFLGWDAFAVSHHLNPLFSTHLNHPYGVNLMWNTAVLLPGALLSPLTTAYGPIVAYNALVTLALPLSGWCAYIAFDRIAGNPVAAAVGGLLYGFSPYMAAQALTHPNFVVALTPPLVLLLLDDLVVRRRWPVAATGGALGLVAAAQLVTGEELLATTGLTCGLGLLLLLGLCRRAAPAPWARVARGLAMALAVFAPLAAVPIVTQFLGPQRMQGILYGGRPYVADLLGFVVPTRMALLSPPAARRISDHFNANLPEQNAYVGLPLLLLLAVIVIHWRALLAVRWAGLLAMIMAVLALGPHLEVAGRLTAIPLPWLLVARLPLLEHVITTRLMLYVFLLIALVLVFFLARVRQEPAGRRRVAGVALVVALAPLIPQLDFPATPKAVPAFFGAPTVTRIPEGSVDLVAPFAARQHVYGGGANAMLWQAAAGMRFHMPEGYAFVPHPPGRDTALRPPRSTTQTVMLAIQEDDKPPALTAALRQELAHDLRSWRVRDVVVGPMAHQGAMLGLFGWLFRHAPEAVGGVYVWWEVQKSL